MPSGNDASIASAEHIGDRIAGVGWLQGFVDEMNARAADLGMGETEYFDPHGNSGNTSSARDLITLARQAMLNPLSPECVATRQYPEGVTPRWTNTNRLLGIEGFDGIKTGLTGGAGGCLVSSGTREGDHLYAVVLGSSPDGPFTDSRNLLRWAWQGRQ